MSGPSDLTVEQALRVAALTAAAREPSNYLASDSTLEIAENYLAWLKS